MSEYIPNIDPALSNPANAEQQQASKADGNAPKKGAEDKLIASMKQPPLQVDSAVTQNPTPTVTDEVVDLSEQQANTTDTPFPYTAPNLTPGNSLTAPNLIPEDPYTAPSLTPVPPPPLQLTSSEQAQLLSQIPGWIAAQSPAGGNNLSPESIAQDTGAVNVYNNIVNYIANIFSITDNVGYLSYTSQINDQLNQVLTLSTNTLADYYSSATNCGTGVAQGIASAVAANPNAYSLSNPPQAGNYAWALLHDMG